MKFTTETGSTYEILDNRVRRLNRDSAKRADGVWVNLFNNPKVEIGQSVTLVMAALARYGPDDDGNRNPGASHTVRRTSHVIAVEDTTDSGSAS